MDKKAPIRPPFGQHLEAYRKVTKKGRDEVLDNFGRAYDRPRKSLIRSFDRLLGYKKNKANNKNNI